MQSLRDDGLAFLGREHSAEEALAALHTARNTFDRLSIDLIYARQNQDPSDWADELSRALDLGLDHMSLYQLTIEPGTHFFTRTRRGESLIADDGLAADMYAATTRVMRDAGMPAYEISNHARPGAECRHNLVYWQAEDWIGVGPGAHGRVNYAEGCAKGRRGIATRRSPIGWLEAVETAGHAIETVIDDGMEDAVAERLMMGLRLAKGIEIADLASRFGDLAGLIDMEAQAELVASGLLADDPDHLRATEDGRLLLNQILAALLIES